MAQRILAPTRVINNLLFPESHEQLLLFLTRKRNGFFNDTIFPFLFIHTAARPVLRRLTLLRQLFPTLAPEPRVPPPGKICAESVKRLNTNSSRRTHYLVLGTFRIPAGIQTRAALAAVMDDFPSLVNIFIILDLPAALHVVSHEILPPT